jgi:hypothetical protein
VVARIEPAINSARAIINMGPDVPVSPRFMT